MIETKTPSIAKYTALVTFLVPLVLALAFVGSGNSQFLFFGLYFFLFAAVVNMVVLIYIAVKAAKRGYPNNLLRGIGLLLLNVLTVIGFVFVGVYFTSIERVTLVNETGQPIYNLVVSGCEEIKIPVLENGDSETVWIDIKNDCNVGLTYNTKGGKQHFEIVLDYVTQGNGQIHEHSIGK